MKRVEFIIYYDNEQYLEECLHYISSIIVPDGYETDVIGFTDTDNICNAYNEIADNSQADIRVYLTQKTFISNKNILNDALGIFESDEAIGIIGACGVCDLPENSGFVPEWRYEFCIEKDDSAYEIQEVMAVHKMLMITNKNFRWREDALSGSDNYELSMCSDCRRKGYKLVVPKTTQKWCYYDGTINDNNSNSVLDNIKSKVISLIEQARFDELEEIYWLLCEMDKGDEEIRAIKDILGIYFQEKKSINGVVSPIFLLGSWKEIIAQYENNNRVILRVELEQSKEAIEQLNSLLDKKLISLDYIREVLASRKCIHSRVFEFLNVQKCQPLVSVVVAVYNAEVFLRDTIESVLNQNYNNIELILVDDCSTDNSREIIKEYQRRDSRVKSFFNDRNYNVCYTENAGINSSHGKYICTVGHDDVLENDKISKQVLYMENHPECLVCFSHVNIIDDFGERIDTKAVPESVGYLNLFNRSNINRETHIRNMILEGNDLCAPSACIRSSVFNSVEQNNMAFLQLQDYDLWLRIMLKGEIYVYMERLTNYRRFFKGHKSISYSYNNCDNYYRTFNERRIIQYQFIKSMKDEDFINVFREELTDINVTGHNEILCEKILLLLLKMNNIFGMEWYLECIENADIKDIMENKYHFTYLDFYEVSCRNIYSLEVRN